MVDFFGSNNGRKETELIKLFSVGLEIGIFGLLGDGFGFPSGRSPIRVRMVMHRR
jgi:hypothetical protein